MIRVRDEGTVRVIRLDRAAKRNALTPEMLATLATAIGDGSPRAIVLCGEGEVFCAGFDLSLCREHSEALRAMLRGLADATRAMRGAGCPVVVSARGAAVAGGCALVAAADVAITHTDARLGYPVVKLGISPAVNTPLLRLAIGDGPARARTLDTELISGEEATRVGLAHECLAEGAECEARAMAIARQLAEKPAGALAATKQWLNHVEGAGTARQDEALRVSLSLVGSAEERERLAAMWAGR